MTSTGVPAFAPEWLALREGADARARSERAVEQVRGHGRVVADLGCGTGSFGRWLAPRLPETRRWVLVDRDPALLALARESVPVGHVRTRALDLASLRARDLDGVTLVAASALLDLLTRAEVEALAGAVVGAGCPALLTLTVSGRVELSPTDPLDARVGRAFDDHQRRGGRLGPDAVAVTAGVFGGLGARTRAFASPWRLGPEHRDLLRAWLLGWVGAAAEQEPGLAVSAYLERRLEQCGRGRLRATVHHTDLVVLAPRAPDAEAP
ncbi:trans-aconitate methyltransferase [Nocardiopsis sp. CNR-923]|uniref:class I SAM-dependent methyltransferase n=1 Tax=Nocardiopsis sp. CNR-923 TaxID=1904965 RepID=UPI000959E490|nr:class I SAM-dependent methyltransferase [Nocardiopsis sp. CNR-923]OLT30666.1 trans-aconitate methyltransferase [Nocardiopsis sp. CNR-923]